MMNCHGTAATGICDDFMCDNYILVYGNSLDISIITSKSQIQYIGQRKKKT